jgi:hypothetical protein
MQVVIMGGLGNKLFQIAYAHELVGKFRARRIKLLHASQVKPNRDFLITPLLANCNHLDFSGETIYLYKLDNFVARVFRIKLLIRCLLKLFRFFSEEHCEKPFNSTLVHKGYFQNFEFSDTTMDMMQRELEKLLDKSSATLPSCGYAVVHLRRGDYLPDQQGLLAFEYYGSILNLQKVKELLVFSDEYSCALKFVKYMGFGLAMNPKDTNEWDLLQYFRNADLVITANSSLSWWGGLLCARNGGQVVVPSPWFRNLAEFEIFCPSGFEIEKSIWVEELESLAKN